MAVYRAMRCVQVGNATAGCVVTYLVRAFLRGALYEYTNTYFVDSALFGYRLTVYVDDLLLHSNDLITEKGPDGVIIVRCRIRDRHINERDAHILRSSKCKGYKVAEKGHNAYMGGRGSICLSLSLSPLCMSVCLPVCLSPLSLCVCVCVCACML